MINKYKLFVVCTCLFSVINNASAREPTFSEAKQLNSPVKALRWAIKHSGNQHNLTDTRLKNLLLVEPNKLYSSVRDYSAITQLTTNEEKQILSNAENAWDIFVMTQNYTPGTYPFFAELKKQLGYEKATSPGAPDKFISLQRELAGVDEDIYNVVKDKIPGIAMRAKYAMAAQLMREQQQLIPENQWFINGIDATALANLTTNGQTINAEDLHSLNDYLSFQLSQGNYQFKSKLPTAFRLVRLAAAYRNDAGFLFGAVCTKEGTHIYDQSYVDRFCLSDMSNKQLYDRWFPRQLKFDHQRLKRSNQKPTFGQKLLELVGVFFAIDGLGAAFLDFFEAAEATELSEAGLLEQEEVSALESEAASEEALAAEEYQGQFCRL
ncbi:hypothetical protein H0A36_19365 [Endozoicomonas sp. SM1973]|uniref:Uncharacterized protein n=1 Tax=Spartinivicinus marinus TaxID=2994442 RepID=A0A853IE14_9GAMM|nr:hypothetical protein [Spartinivicinus marinus]MCX4027574.1 hypothetical protein [Spartinivicinus marinus]NYZ68181.1 hypothetical protein [Spartinivicinus marinus]